MHDEQLYGAWLNGNGTKALNDSPSARIGYITYLEQKVREKQRQLADCQRQNTDLKAKLDRRQQ